jgi:hypothetical protein
MERGLLDLHNLLRWVVLVLALMIIFRSSQGMSGKKPFSKGNKKLALFLMISADVQLLLGLSLYFMKGWWDMLTAGGVMKNAYNRFFAVEHFLGMVLALVLIHLGYAATKKEISDQAKFRKLFWFTLIALVVIIISIPWPFRFDIARPWFPGMGV